MGGGEEDADPLHDLNASEGGGLDEVGGELGAALGVEPLEEGSGEMEGRMRRRT